MALLQLPMKPKDRKLATIFERGQMIVTLQRRYDELKPFIKFRNIAHDRTIKNLAERFEADLDRTVYIGKHVRLNDKLQEMEETFSKLVQEVGRQERWWEGTNIFSKSIAHSEVLSTLLTQSPLTELSYVSYASYVSDMMFSIAYNFPPGAQWNRDCLPVLVKEIFRIKKIPGGQQPAFNLLIALKVHLLQEPDTTVVSTEKTHLQLNSILGSALRSQKSRTQNKPFWNLAKASRSVRERMYSNTCELDVSEFIEEASESAEYPGFPCIHNALMPLLDSLQRHAYFEVRENVRFATSRYLPAELTHMVFEHTMVAEEIPLDPRILVFAQHRNGLHPEKVVRKCRLPCSHEEIESPESSRAGMYHQFVLGTDWVEVTPTFAHLTVRCYEDIDEHISDDELVDCDYFEEEIYASEKQNQD